MPVTILPIPAFNDNYIWCLVDGDRAAVVDPGDARPVLRFLQDRQLQLTAILITHHHPDHVGGLPMLLETWPDCPVYGPQNQVAEISTRLNEGDSVELFGLSLSVIAVPGHTLDHIAYFGHNVQQPLLFCGDTLFAGGCGRIFEGSSQQMFFSLNKLKSLPANTQMYCAHEYTLKNLEFARQVEPDNPALMQRIADATALREQDLPTVPSTIALEVATNPFLRSDASGVKDTVTQRTGSKNWTDEQIFATLRAWKDRS